MQTWEKADIEQILLGAEDIDAITTRLAAKITEDLADNEGAAPKRPVLAVAVLRGSVVFFSDLIRKLPFGIELDFVKVSSYFAGTQSTGELRFDLDLRHEDCRDADILLVEDIVDSGRTLKILVQHLLDRGAHSVKTVALLDKPSRRAVDFEADYVGQVIPDVFVVGYGLDYAEKYRNLSYIGVLKPEVYAK